MEILGNPSRNQAKSSQILGRARQTQAKPAKPKASRSPSRGDAGADATAPPYSPVRALSWERAAMQSLELL